MLTDLKVDVESYGPFTATSESDFDRVMSVNAKGSFLVTQAVARMMQEQEPRTFVPRLRHRTRQIGRGSIVNIASALAFGAVPGKAAYIASKHALLGITRSAGK
jgi:NAD(P)-dependent dehydrogenase (short-subunit alcohol dehydrogenase family)